MNEIELEPFAPLRMTIQVNAIAVLPTMKQACDFVALLNNKTDCGRLLLLQLACGKWAVCLDDSGSLKN